MYGPILYTERLRLRPHEPNDAAAFVRYLSDPDVTRWLARRVVPTLEEERDWIVNHATNPKTLGWTIEVEHRPVGVIGFGSIDWECGHATVGTFIGDKSLWHDHLGSEIGTLVLDYVFTQRRWRKVNGGYIDGNEASAALQRKFGFVEVGRWHQHYFRDGAWRDHVCMELMKGSWLGRRH